MSSRFHRDAWKSAAVAVILAVIAANFGGDGWESNPPRTPQQRPANGFEDRGASVPNRPPTNAAVRLSVSIVSDRPPASTEVRRLGCHLGCQRPKGFQPLTF